MIYLIEDKKSRRCDYGWTDSKVNLFRENLCLIEDITTLLSIQPNIGNNDVILFHESFVNTVDFENRANVKDLQKSLEDKKTSIVYFSGSKIQRTLDENVCNLPPYVMYPNLECFINHYINGELSFQYLMFGDNYELEENTRNDVIRIKRENLSYKTIQSGKKLAFIIANEQRIKPPFSDAIVIEGFDFACDDFSFCDSVDQKISNEKFDAIYVPLCFGETLSDFLGLRLAMIIRFSLGINRLTPILLYGQAQYRDLIGNECFDILKMPGVYYVGMDYKSIIDSLDKIRGINENEFLTSVKNIHLNIPTDLGDNHSVTNKWAISRWSYILDHYDTNELQDNNKKVYNTLYFRYLTALYSSEYANQIDSKDLIINKTKDQAKLKVLYIDDQADDGWYELLCRIIYDVNKLDFDYLGEDLKSKSKAQIIDIAKQKIIDYQPNVVILDLRLHSSDATQKDISKVSGYQLLKTIKSINRGIQVLVFSATNRIWDLQSLMKIEADGFIVKESPSDSNDPNFTEQTIRHFLDYLNECAKQTYRFELWSLIQEDKKRLQELKKLKCANKPQVIQSTIKTNDLQNLKEYSAAVEKLLSMAEESMFSKSINNTFASTFIVLFTIIEATVNQWIEDKPSKENFECDKPYYFKFRDSEERVFYFKENNCHPNGYYKSDKELNLPYMQKIANVLYRVDSYSENTSHLVQKRNDFTHTNIVKNRTLEEFSVSDVIDIYSIVHTIIQKQN